MNTRTSFPHFMLIRLIIAVLVLTIIVWLGWTISPLPEQTHMDGINRQMDVCMANDYTRDECITLLGRDE